VALRETGEHESRAAITPESVRKLLSIGGVGEDAPSHTVAVETEIGRAFGLTDALYQKAGAEVEDDRKALLGSADVILHVDPPHEDEFSAVRSGAVMAGFLGVWDDPERIRQMAEAGLSALSLELMPRTTRAQTMDAISSQHSLAGYAMAILAAQRLSKVLPMMVTPSGTLQPARVLVIGAGVAGLQAIATAHRLGARVEAFDTRPATKEQVESLGAKFIEIDLGETGEAEGGYAKELTEEQKKRQQEALAKSVAKADVVITTAAIPGKKAPVIVTDDMVQSMQAGAVIIDYAANRGGNVEGTRPNEEVVTDGDVRIVGLMNYPDLVAADASRMLASNLQSLVKHISGEKGEKPEIDAMLEAGDEIVKGCLVAHKGEVVSDIVRERLS